MENQSEIPTQLESAWNISLSYNPSITSESWDPLVIATAIVLAVLVILASVGNFLVCRTVWVCRRLHIPPFYLLASLSFSDLLVGVLIIPLSLAYHVTFQSTGRWIFGQITCSLWLYMNFILCSASIFNLCAFSGDRFLAVTSPLNYISRMNSCRVKQVIGLSWFCALSFGGFVMYALLTSREMGINCSVWGLRFEFAVVILITGYILPVIFLIFVNGKVFFIARSHLTRIHAQEISLAVTPDQVSSIKTGVRKGRSQRSRVKQEMKMFKTFLIVTLSFLFSWTPFIVILLADSVTPVPTIIRHLSIIILYCNSAMNPFTYGFFNSEFRMALLEMFKFKLAQRKTRVEHLTEHAQGRTISHRNCRHELTVTPRF